MWEAPTYSRVSLLCSLSKKLLGLHDDSLSLELLLLEGLEELEEGVVVQDLLGELLGELLDLLCMPPLALRLLLLQLQEVPLLQPLVLHASKLLLKV